MTATSADKDGNHQQIEWPGRLYMGRCSRCGEPRMLFYDKGDEGARATLKCTCKSKSILIGRYHKDT